MSGWELFTWLNVVILGVGSVWVFVQFLLDLPQLLSRVERAASGAPADEEP